MKAAVWTGYGPPDVLQLREVETPAPKSNEVRIRIHATTVTTGDCAQRKLALQFWYRIPMRAYVGLRTPKRITIMGMELAGEIESVGEDVRRFREGDQVFAATGFVTMGSYAEYICLPENPEGGALAIKPANMTHEEAASVPVGGLEALCFLREGGIQSGQRVLVNGASGTIGIFAIQLAKYYGAEVTGVASAAKLDMLRFLGADRVIDYTQDDFTSTGETYDLVIDVAGKSSFPGVVRSLEQTGRYVIADPVLSQLVRGRWTSMTSGKRVMFGPAHPKTEDLVFLKELVEAGKIRSIIDRRYPLEQIAEAHRYVEAGRKKGHVVISIKHDETT